MPLAYLTRIAQTPAPTFHEEERAQLIETLWRELGYRPERDAVGNVLVKLGPSVSLSSAASPHSKALLLAAHLDTVFSSQTDVTVREEGGRLVGPGVGDNSSSLAVLSAFLRDLDPAQLRRPLWLAANVGEEGLGDLRGAKALLSAHAPELSAFVAVDGYLGVAVTKAVGVRRYRVTFTGQGGHSWGDQAPSALHALGLAITALYALPLPQSPRTTLNVGTASGGNSVNSIAGSAELLLDLRSLDAQLLADLDNKARYAVQGAARQAGVQVRLDQVGDRPGGNLRSDTLLRLARLASQPVGIDLKTAASSTDANAAAPHGVPSMALGVYRGGNAHREDEWVQPSSLSVGLGILQRFVRGYMHE
ncbi:M20/M25/M40 family metallo-hydrolase [Deinococcus psychrotolerans]|uniref:M20/M25/M40 family metallo-hydrolase n=1 Tax=Deinococcus psychrotolerans TaxID=2489213 RepID=A0A3G8YPX6_9DEIO|nr:M20/M25/M40 family metallo-hydrolase [Deinococcus psychrotolerans]AZI43236.1 M20/M25/M40 family metallo-hydrolase [Deinococcus psychrotolerans]